MTVYHITVYFILFYFPNYSNVRNPLVLEFQAFPDDNQLKAMTHSETQRRTKRVDEGSYLPMKSITRRPSEYRPAGLWKNVSPLGGGAWPQTADKPPVSEFESPKLNMAGKSQLVAVANTNHGTELTEIVSVRKKRVESIGERIW